jgi:hypothetical protein
MPYPPVKNENYANLGGIDVKSSQYITEQMEFLNLRNIDFRTVGALSSFAGSTAFTSVNSTLPVLGVADYFSTSYNAGGAVTPGNSNYIAVPSLIIVGVDQQNVCEVTGGTFAPFLHSRISGGVLNPTSFVLANYLYGCNGIDGWVYQGSTQALQFSLGKPCLVGSNTTTRSNTNTPGLSGFLTMYYAMVRQDGLYGPAAAVTYTCTGETMIIVSPNLSPNIKMALTGNPGGVMAPANVSMGSFGLSGIQAWAQLNTTTPYALNGLLGLSLSAAGLTVGFNYTAVGWSINTSLPHGGLPYDYQGAFVFGLGSTQGSDNAQATGSNPNMQEYFANQLFSAGFGGSYRSRVIFSNAGTPEEADYRNFFDVAPNDPNGVSAMKSYFTQMGIWKPSSTWALTGTGPDTFNLTNVSPIYGCISKRAVCVWNQNCWFLDKQGICEFNGANTQVVSTKMQDFFDRMNVSVAYQSAIMVHVKQRNEVWCAIPIDGSAFNNIIIIYDYIAKAWTTAPCPAGNLTAINVLSLGQSSAIPYFGNYSGLVGTWGSSFIGDNGSGVTHVIKSRFIQEMGNSVTKMFRRLYLDAKVPSGSTQAIAVNLYADYATSPTYQTTMVISNTPVQQRIDFGVPGKALAVELIYNGNGGFLQLNGFTIEYRFQRAT